MAYNIEEEAKRFITSKKRQFKKGLTEASDNMTQYILDNLHSSNERDYAIKALKEAILWCNSSTDKDGIK